MDHPCYKCGQSVEDGKAFCLQCGAPQIRVAMPEAIIGAVAETADSNQLPIFSSNSGEVTSLGLDAGIVWPRALRACAVAVLVAVFITVLRLVVPLLSILSTGCLAVIFYRLRNPMWKANARSGAKLGALSGLMFSAIATGLAAVFVLMLQAGGEVRQQMIEAFQQAASQSNDPQWRAALDLLNTPEGLASKLLHGMLVLAILSIAAGSIAGALTGAFLGRHKRL